MTDNEIIKALECCSTAQNCTPCKYEPSEYEKGTVGCCNELMKNALDLIKRHQAEIEKLSKPQGVTFLANGIEIHAKDSDEYYKFKRLVKADAITEFAERLKIDAVEVRYCTFSAVVRVADINTLVKEMVGVE
ncbi:MAG: hypothetical protein E7485_08325 [Ruminococcaceae bacterium]|nr:hypothetical protein [Oscillospiraceae bacterium]